VLRPWPPRKPAVFVNHTGRDQHLLSGLFAADLADALQSGGIQAFIDYTGIGHGDVWPSTLREEAASCAVFVAVVSEPYTRRFWPMHELDIAMQRWREERANPGGGGGGAGGLRGHILPVLFEGGGDAPVRPADVAAFWRNEAALRPLTDEERGCVEAARWAANVAALKDELQSKRGGAFHHKGSLVRVGADAGRWRALCVGQGALFRMWGPAGRCWRTRRACLCLQLVPPISTRGTQVELRKSVVRRVMDLLPVFEAPEAVGFEGQEHDLLELLKEQTAAAAGEHGIWLHGIGALPVVCKAPACRCYTGGNGMMLIVPISAVATLDLPHSGNHRSQVEQARAPWPAGCLPPCKATTRPIAAPASAWT
jgi:hypothetical protein